MKLDYIECGDCLELIKGVPDNSVDLVVTDPPYEFQGAGFLRGGGAFGDKKKDYHNEYQNLTKEAYELKKLSERKLKQGASVKDISDSFNFEILDECCRVLKKMNFYVWCSKTQVRKLLNYFEDKGCFIDILCWHKTNPIPTCNGTYLNDTEYLIFAREKGVKVYGSYKTKRKWYVTPTNKKDKDKYKHPTIKPLEIIENLIINSSVEGGGNTRYLYG